MQPPGFTGGPKIPQYRVSRSKVTAEDLARILKEEELARIRKEEKRINRIRKEEKRVPVSHDETPMHVPANIKSVPLEQLTELFKPENGEDVPGYFEDEPLDDATRTKLLERFRQNDDRFQELLAQYTTLQNEFFPRKLDIKDGRDRVEQAVQKVNSLRRETVKTHDMSQLDDDTLEYLVDTYNSIGQLLEALRQQLGQMHAYLHDELLRDATDTKLIFYLNQTANTIMMSNTIDETAFDFYLVLDANHPSHSPGSATPSDTAKVMVELGRLVAEFQAAIDEWAVRTRQLVQVQQIIRKFLEDPQRYRQVVGEVHGWARRLLGLPAVDEEEVLQRLDGDMLARAVSVMRIFVDAISDLVWLVRTVLPSELVYVVRLRHFLGKYRRYPNRNRVLTERLVMHTKQLAWYQDQSIEREKTCARFLRVIDELLQAGAGEVKHEEKKTVKDEVGVDQLARVVEQLEQEWEQLAATNAALKEIMKDDLRSVYDIEVSVTRIVTFFKNSTHIQFDSVWLSNMLYQNDNFKAMQIMMKCLKYASELLQLVNTDVYESEEVLVEAQNGRLSAAQLSDRYSLYMLDRERLAKSEAILKAVEGFMVQLFAVRPKLVPIHKILNNVAVRIMFQSQKMEILTLIKQLIESSVSSYEKRQQLLYSLIDLYEKLADRPTTFEEFMQQVDNLTKFESPEPTTQKSFTEPSPSDAAKTPSHVYEWEEIPAQTPSKKQLVNVWSNANKIVAKKIKTQLQKLVNSLGDLPSILQLMNRLMETDTRSPDFYVRFMEAFGAMLFDENKILVETYQTIHHITNQDDAQEQMWQYYADKIKQVARPDTATEIVNATSYVVAYLENGLLDSYQQILDYKKTIDQLLATVPFDDSKVEQYRQLVNQTYWTWDKSIEPYLATRSELKLYFLRLVRAVNRL